MKAAFRWSFGVVAATVAVGFAVAALASDPANLVGSTKCGMCHKTAAKGDQLGKWKASPHAKAFEVLATPEAKEVAAKLKIEDPQKSGACLSCHSTAYFGTDKVANATMKVEEGVSCESCHGPGKGYMSPATMKDHAKAVAAGLTAEPAKTCVGCHNEKNPTWKADRYTLKDGKKVGFDFDQAWAKINHDDPTTTKK